MPSTLSETFDCPTPEATAALARRLAPLVGAGDTLLLDGPLGAGKTHFARSLIQARLARAGLTEDVPSPSFTLVQTYDDSIVEIVHADLYRLDSADLGELGLEDAFATALCLVEWPDRLDTPPPGALHIRFDPEAGSDARRLHISGPERWAPVFGALA